MRYTVQCKKVAGGDTSANTPHTVNGKCGHMVNEKLQYLDRLDVSCSGSYAIQKIWMQSCGGDKKKYVATCINTAGKTSKASDNSFLAKNKKLEYLDRSTGPNCQHGKNVLKGFKFRSAGGNNFRYHVDCIG